MKAAALDRAWLLAHLPHQGRMNLLESIVAWDASTVRALARGHHAPDHPLRRAGELPIAGGIEYAAQAAAAHGALAARQACADGFLASVRSVVFHARRLDEEPGDLEVFAEQLGSGSGGVLYRFEVASPARTLVTGRLTVAFRR